MSSKPALISCAYGAVPADGNTCRVDFAFQSPEWQFLKPLSPSSPIYLDKAHYACSVRAGEFIANGALPGVTALMEERYSLALGLGELTHCFVEEKFSSEDNLIFMKVAMWDSKRSWCKFSSKAKFLGTAESFAKRRKDKKQELIKKAPVQLEQTAFERPSADIVGFWPFIGTLTQDNRSVFLPNLQELIHKHPFTSGTGDHFNAAMVKEAGLQFAKLIAYERFNKKRVSELVANHTRYLFFLEFEIPIEIRLISVDPTFQASHLPFSNCEAGQVSSEWAENHDLMHLAVDFVQNNRVCSKLEMFVAVPRNAKL